MSVNTYVDQKTCASCGGRCGKRHAGALFPSDSSFRLTQAPAVMAHGLLCAHTFHQIMQETPFAG